MNFIDDDCDDVVDPGCRVFVHRSVQAPRSIHYYSTDLSEARCCDRLVEQENYFQLYTESTTGLAALYRCHEEELDVYLLTTEADCGDWGPAAREGELGYLATSEIEGTTELFHLYNDRNDDHFYTISAVERDSAASGVFEVAASPGFVFVP